jgi:subfamily B ATP-binding cassette protein MsbA
MNYDKKTPALHRFRVVLPYIRPYTPYLLGALGLTVVLTILALLPPLIMREFIDRVLTAGQWQILLPIIVAQALVPIMSGLISFFNTLIIAYTGRRLVFDVRTAMYRHLLRLSMRFHGEMSSGAVMSRLMSDVNQVQNLVTGNTITLVTDIVSFLFAGFVTFSLNWKMAILLWIMLPLYILNYHFFVKRIRRSNRKLRRTLDRIAGTLQERLSGTRRVRAFGREEDETERFLEETQESLRHSMSGTVHSVSFSTASRFIWGIGSTILYMLGVYFALHGEMTYGSVTAFMAYVSQMFGPALRFTELANQLEQVMVSVDRIFEVLNTEPDIKEKADAAVLPAVTGHIEFDHVTFGYKADEPVIKDVYLNIPAGKMVALVGHTGCGKTTLTTLLMRLWDIQEGAIRVDGHDVRDVSLSSLRRRIGIVLQDPLLFNATIAENLRYGYPEATMEEVTEAAKAAEIHDMIVSQPGGYETELGGESGIKLSVGEKQRMAIARAIITNPGILVLDEATSSLDSESEMLIQKALARVMKDRTSLVIAHRLSTIIEADVIVVMDQGRVIESGSHAELVRKEGHYAQLFHQQHGKTKVAPSQPDAPAGN